VVTSTREPLSPAERAEFSQPVFYTPTVTTLERVIVLSGWLVAALFCVGMAGAFYLGSTGLAGLLHVATLAGVGVMGLAAAYAVYRAIRALMPVRAQLMRPALPAGVTHWEVQHIDVAEAWWVNTGDDDTETLLIRTGNDQYMVLHDDGLSSSLWRDSASAGELLAPVLVRRQIPNFVTLLEQVGPPDALTIGKLDVSARLPREPEWWCQDGAQFTGSELGDDLPRMPLAAGSRE
jgi:hypothetical protein